MVSRRRPYDADLGRHELWLSAGGRAGHHGLWALDTSEGIAGGAEPRQWKTDIRPVSIAEAQLEKHGFEATEERRARKAMSGSCAWTPRAARRYKFRE